MISYRVLLKHLHSFVLWPRVHFLTFTARRLGRRLRRCCNCATCSTILFFCCWLLCRQHWMNFCIIWHNSQQHVLFYAHLTDSVVSKQEDAWPGSCCDMQPSRIITKWSIFTGEVYSVICVEWAVDHFCLGLMKIRPLLTELGVNNNFLHFRSWPWPQIHSPVTLVQYCFH